MATTPVMRHDDERCGMLVWDGLLRRVPLRISRLFANIEYR
jgi:hypothetical protein